MSRRGDCHDNAVAESFSQLLKRERIKKKIYDTREEARGDILITSKCFISVSVGMVRAMRCYRQNMKTSIINGSEVSRFSVAIQARYVEKGRNKPAMRSKNRQDFTLVSDMDF